MQISTNTKISDLLSAHPFLEDFLVAYDPHFGLLRNKLTRATVARLATVGTAARVAAIDPAALLSALAAAIKDKETGPKIGIAPDEPKQEKSVPDQRTDGAAGAQPATRGERIAMLGQIIAELHNGGDLASARGRFTRAVGDVEAGEIAAMEEEMIRGGLPVGEVQRLCGLHVDAFRDALDDKRALEAPAGHPVATYMADNRVIVELADRLGELARMVADKQSMPGEAFAAAGSVLDRYGGLDNHFLRKENQLFPMLEMHGVIGPSQVMWGVHDTIRAQWKSIEQAVAVQDAPTFAAEAAALARELVEMVYKEERILFPLAMEKLTEAEWAEEKRGEDTIGYVFAKPVVALPLLGGRPKAAAAVAMVEPSVGTVDAAGLPLKLGTGVLSLEVLDLILKHLPLDISFVDENDVVRYYSDGKERIFPRSPAAIGRKVQNCHPPKSVATVNHILDAFKAGTKEVAEFWIAMGPRLVHIRYFAVRDAERRYRGCLEVTQDIAPIKGIEGQRRLLDWDN